MNATLEALRTNLSQRLFSNQSVAEPRPHLFGSRGLDFLLLGGLAILVWLPLYFFQDSFGWVGSFGLWITTAVYTLGYFVNYPHFMASYALAYRQEKGFILQNWFQLIAVPLLLIALIMSALLFWSVDIRSSSSVLAVNGFFESLGWQTRFGQYENLGSELTGILVLLMYFTVGWHYAKQAFGCMMVYAKLDNYAFTNNQRLLLRYTLLSTWWLSFFYSNCSVGEYNFYELKIFRLGLPYAYYQLAYAAVALLYLATFVTVFGKNYLDTGRLPSLNMLIPMLALALWHVPLLGQEQYFYAMAFFHSLQYFPFVAKVEQSRNQIKQKSHPSLRLLPFYIVLIIVGYLAFTGVPEYLDKGLANQTTLGVSFFLICFISFINVHHYFIDNVIWRFKSKQVKEYLFH